MNGDVARPALSVDDVARYRRDGQMTPTWRLTPTRLSAMRASLARLLEALLMAGASQSTPVEFKQRPIWLFRGEDRCGRNDFAVGHVHW